MKHDDVYERRAWHRCRTPGKVVFNSEGWNRGHFECEGCKQAWNFYRIGKFTVQDLDDRFYMPVQRDPETKILVWKTEGKQKFISSVPLKDAEGLERIQL